jgi:ArsR family metal-binding transcriptional regulator
MLLTGYRKDIFRPTCNPSFQSVHCYAHLDDDIQEVLPYLNTVLGGSDYAEDPPSVMFQIHGRLIAVYPRKIAVNALKDEAEADKILEWLRMQINDTWEKRDDIEPSYGVSPKPQAIEVLKLLPKTNCGHCGQATCMVFSFLVIQGAKGPEDCPLLDDQRRRKLEEYLIVTAHRRRNSGS